MWCVDCVWEWECKDSVLSLVVRVHHKEDIMEAASHTPFILFLRPYIMHHFFYISKQKIFILNSQFFIIAFPSLPSLYSFTYTYYICILYICQWILLIVYFIVSFSFIFKKYYANRDANILIVYNKLSSPSHKKWLIYLY